MTIIDELYDVLQKRKNAAGEKSYVASLYEKGAPKMCEKIREEAEELIVEALALEKDAGNEDIRNNLKNETADLLFHVWVVLAHYDITPGDIAEILEARFGTSGHDEKAARKK